jgi:arginyl-tRNA synthetase
MLFGFFQHKINEAIKRLYNIDFPVIVSVPSQKNAGDLTTNVAFLLSKNINKSVPEIALEIIEELKKDQWFTYYTSNNIVEAKGHLNWNLNQTAFSDALYILYNDSGLGQNDALVGEDIAIEFVSANPTGPLSVVNGRAAVIGDTLVNIFEKSGAYVRSHYYVNDNPQSGQIIALQNTFDYYDKIQNGEEIDFPADGYQGEAIKKAWKHYNKLKHNCENNNDAFFKYGVGQLTFEQTGVLHASLGIRFSNITSENEIIKQITIQEAFKYAGKNIDDFTYLSEGALWLKTKDYGDDKDRVIIREDGRPTYFHNDIIYHAHKIMYSPCGTRLINIWGADHHGYIARMNAVMRMWSKPDIEIILTQMVNLEIEENGESKIFMGSKRDGQYLLLKEDFVDKIGQDAARWYFLNSDPSNHTTINVAKAAEQNMNNPVFYVQYAHARFCRILSKSNDLNVTIGNQFINLHLNSSKEATNLILKLDMYSDVVSRAAFHLNPQLVKIYLYELAQLMHIFYENDRLIYQNKENWLAGLYLVKTASNVLKDGLNLLGISAPEHMAPSDCE